MSTEHPKESLEELLASVAHNTAAPSRWEASGGAQPDEELITLLRFTLRGQLYAVPGEQVREVISASPPTRLPGAPPYIRGVVVHRRQVIGVLDLERWLELDEANGPADDADQGRVVILEHHALSAGILTSSLTQLMTWPMRALTRALTHSLPARSRAYARAMLDTEDGPLLVLDVARLLDDAALR